MIGVKRSAVAPRPLIDGSAQDRYRHDDVVDRLMEDFHGKCYICEIDSLQSIEVEHLLPHHNGKHPDRKFDWNNLFLSCGHCNSVKNKSKYDGHVIDCCRRDPEALLEQELVGDEVRVGVLAEDDQEARSTAELIEEVFMSENPRIRALESDVRLKGLQKQMNMLYANLRDYRRNHKDRVALMTLKLILRPEARFAGFARCYVRKHLLEYPELEPCVRSVFSDPTLDEQARKGGA